MADLRISDLEIATEAQGSDLIPVSSDNSTKAMPFSVFKDAIQGDADRAVAAVIDMQSAATHAKNAASDANSAAQSANTAAENADDKAQAAQEAATAAQASKENADTAAQSANGAASSASTAASNANEKALSAQSAASSATTAASLANAAAQSATTQAEYAQEQGAAAEAIVSRWKDVPVGSLKIPRSCRAVVGTSTAGWTANDCDYLCDGTDDQQEIQAAVDAVISAGGGEVLILSGTYNVNPVTQSGTTQCVLVSGNAPVSICGEGMRHTILSLQSGTQSATWRSKIIKLIGSGAKTVKDLCVTAVDEPSVTKSRDIIGIEGTSNVKIIRCAAFRLGIGFNVMEGNCTITNCKIGSPIGGWDYEHDSCAIGINADQTGLITNNNISSDEGIRVSAHAIVIGNHIEADKIGINATGPNNNICIIGNYITALYETSGNYHYGIYLGGLLFSVVSGNMVNSSSMKTSTAEEMADIFLGYDVERSIVTDNSTYGHGIVINYTGTEEEIATNLVDHNVEGGRE